MDITTRNRKELKSYFVKNSIPTESNFAELIDGQLNQKDDGLVKLPGNPLSVEAAGDSTSEKKVLQLYQSFGDQNPAWLVSLNPRSNPADPVSTRLGFNIGDGDGKSRLFIDRSSGSVGLGTVGPLARLDVLQTARSGTHPTAIKGLYVTGDFGGDSDGVEFRHSNATQGIGFGYNTIYAAGTNANQDLSLKPRGTGVVKIQGALQPSAGGTSGNGIMFPSDPFGGSGDAAWVRYHNARGGERGTLEIGIANDIDDHIVLLPSGNVGVGTASPTARLEVAGSGGTNVDLLVNGRLRSNNNDGGLWITADRFIGGHSTNKLGVWMGDWRLTVQSDGNVGIGTTAPVARLDVLSVARSGTHPTAVKGLYVTGDFGADSDGVEFRHSNATVGIGFGYNTIYAAGTNANQDLSLKPRGTGVVKVTNSLQVSGAITPSAGNTASTGITFPADAFGGGGDLAWMRYHNARGGESATLELGIANDPDDHIVLLPSGNVGVGATAPLAKLDVLSATRSGTHPTAVKGLYVTGDFGGDADGVEFRHSNSSQGIGFGYNTIYAAGTNTDQDLALKPRGAGVVKVTSSLQVSGYVAAQQVYFSAYVDTNDRTGQQNPLPMKQTSQNVGGAYDITTSKFTAPVKGVYLFTMTGMRVDQDKTNDLSWALMVNDNFANNAGTTTAEANERCHLTWPANVIGTSSRTILLALSKGDKVYVQQLGTGRCDNYRSGLEGVLLYATV